MSGDERHTKRHTRKSKSGRGQADRFSQLGRVQRKLLRWLYGQHLGVMVRGTPPERKAVESRGVPWRKVAAHVGERPSAVSEALSGRGRSLEARKLVTVTRSSGGRTTHVGLTPAGWFACERVDEDSSVGEAWEGAVRTFEDFVGPRSGWSREDHRAFGEFWAQVEERLRRRRVRDAGESEVTLTPDALGRFVVDLVRRRGGGDGLWRARVSWDWYTREVRVFVAQKDEED